MAKKIEWLDQFANDQYSKMTKTASHKKVANQIIVDCSTYPNAKVGTLVNYDNTKYKIVDTKYRDKSGPGILLEEVTACGGNCGPVTTGEVQTNNGVIPATTEVKNPPTQKTAAKKNFDLDFDALADFDDSKFDDSKFDDSKFDDSKFDDSKFDDSADATESDFSATETTNELSGNSGNSEYPDIITRPGGVKPIPSADIEGPGKKRVTDAPYHPTYDPGEKYALESQDEWQDAADRTASAIQQEDAQDRTTVEGHYTWNQYIDAILDEDPADALIMTDAEIPDVNETETTFDDEDTSLDIDESDTDFDSSADVDTDTDADDVDSAVDSMLDLDDSEENTDADTADFDDNEEDVELPDDKDFSMNDEELPADEDISVDEDNDIPEDFSSENFETDDNEDFSMNDEDLDIPDEEEEPKMASNQSKTKQLSRLAFKNQ